jgi:hypothetical protein
MTRPGTPPHGPGRRRAPVPDGWPGDDPTIEDDVALLGGKRYGRHDRPRAARRGGGHRDGRPTAAGAGRVRDDVDPAGRPEVYEADIRPDGAVGRMLGRTVDDVEQVDATDRDASDPGADAAEPAPSGDHHDAVAGRMPAGRVLVVMVASLVLAMLVNADALVERAERRPPGRDRERALAVWEPVQDVSHVLQLHRIRQLADWAAGDDGTDTTPLGSREQARRGSAASGAASTGTTEPSDEGDGGAAPADDESGAQRAPELRRPTEDEPLRLWVGGDSMAQELGSSLAADTEATGLVDATVRVEGASGLARPDYFDWPATLAAEVDEEGSEIVVFTAGVNDGQGLVLEDGTAVPEVADPRWAPEYRRRVADVMDLLQRDDRLVLWIVLPPMADPGYASRQRVIREAVTAEAGERPWVLPVDAAGTLAGPDGGYAAELPGPDGAPVAVRRSDGIHLTDAGGDRLAQLVYDVIAAHVDLD